MSAFGDLYHHFHARVGRELVYAYLTGVGFLVVVYPQQGNAKASRTGKQLVESSRLFLFKVGLVWGLEAMIGFYYVC